MTPVNPGHPISPEPFGSHSADGSVSPCVAPAKPPHSLRAFLFGKALLALVALGLLCGCGGGLGFTGGSIPPGGTRLFGRVVQAENPLEPLARATIQVDTRPVTGGHRTFVTKTGTDGTFSLPSVATGTTYATFIVTVTPEAGTPRQSQQIVFRADNGVADNLIVTLPLNTFDVTSAKTLTLQNIVDIPPNSSIAIHARLLDSNGKRLPVQPTLLFAGNFGSIALDETFAASDNTGSGSVTAFWYGLPPAGTTITVDAHAVEPPPAAPDFPAAPGSTTPVPGGPPLN